MYRLWVILRRICRDLEKCSKVFEGNYIAFGVRVTGCLLTQIIKALEGKMKS